MKITPVSPRNKPCAIVLAAGMSQRMGRPKMLLPWGHTTMLGRVVSTLANCGIRDIVVVTGGTRELVEAEVGMLSRLYPARAIFNPEFEHGEMLSSVQTGLRALDPEAAATLIALGDQPQIEERTVRGLLGMAANIQQRILIPSYQNRRGHPIFFGKHYFDELLNLSAPDNMHTFIQSHLPEIIYLESNPSVLQDVDTLEDYNKATN